MDTIVSARYYQASYHWLLVELYKLSTVQTTKNDESRMKISMNGEIFFAPLCVIERMVVYQQWTKRIVAFEPFRSLTENPSLNI